MNLHFARLPALALGLALAFPAVAEPAKDPVVAVVNGTEIHLSQVAEFQRTLPPQLGQAPYEALLDTLVNNQLVYEQARREKVENDPEVKAALKQIEQKVLRQAWMNKRLKADVTEDAIRKAYDKFLREFQPQEEVRARHVLLETEDQAKAVIAELAKGGDFAEVAKAKSKDPSAQQNGGDLGYFTKGEMVPQFSEAAFAMKPGELSSKPVKSQFGFHVIKVEDKRAAQPPTLEQARGPIREQLAEASAEKLVTDLRAKAKVKRFGPDGQPLPDAPAPAAPARK